MKWPTITWFKSKASAQEERESVNVPFGSLNFNDLQATPSTFGNPPLRRGARVSPSQARPQMIDYQVTTWPRNSLTMAVTRGSGLFARFHQGRGPLYLSPSDSANSYEDMLALDEHNVKRGVNSKVLSNMVVTAGRAEASETCFICIDAMRSGVRVARLPCKHIFCDDCIRPWLQDHRTCPVCRWEFPDTDTHLVK